LGQLDRHEHKLVKHLRAHERITLQEFMHCANLSRRRASRILTRLEDNGFIRSHDVERRIFYTLNSGWMFRG
jgi:predicted transcriptional regulator